MEDADIEQRFYLIQKQIEATVSLTRECQLDLMAAIDSLRIELEVLKSYIERYHPVLRSLNPKLGKRRFRQSIQNGLARSPEKRLQAANPVGLDGALPMCRNHR